ncbi:hypothetical protein DFQ28_001651 [Apophysomyces sp. BC1034]|nr:hypothetical protein DFQ28_001651 [Apophysomyces sp. BC1034]
MKDNDDDTYPTGSQKDSGMLLYKENVPNPDPFAELKVLDDNHLKLRVQSLFEERNANLKRLIEDVFSVVTEISDIIQQTTTIQDELTLDAYNREVQVIQQMESDQKRMRDQVVRFVHATSTSFAEIFQQEPSV